MVRVAIKEKNHAHFLDFLNNEFIDKMSVYDYYFKVVLTGDDTKGKSYLASNFSESYFGTDYKYTIGVDFHVNILTVLGITMKMQLWELLSKERFKSLAPMYYRGAMGAIIVFDISKSDFQNDLEDTIQLIKERAGDIPIVLLTFKHHSKEIQVVSGVGAMLTAANYNSSLLAEISLKPNQNPDVIFNNLAEHIIERCEVSPPPRPLERPLSIRTDFVINKYIS